MNEELIEKVKSLFIEITHIYSKAQGMLPDNIPEKRLVLERMAESCQWLRIAIEIAEANIKNPVNIRVKEKQYADQPIPGN